MAVNRLDSSKEPPKDGDKKPAAPEAAAAPAVAPASGGIKPWLPLILNLLLMPALAYGVTTFVIAPKLNGATKTASSSGAAGEHGSKSKESAEHGGGSKETGGRIKQTAPLGGKVLVNVAGTMGTRYLLANITLVGADPELKIAVERNDAELRDAAASALSGKTIQDLEKPGARNLVRTELISVFNSILGSGLVSEIYLTEFAIQ